MILQVQKLRGMFAIFGYQRDFTFINGISFLIIPQILGCEPID